MALYSAGIADGREVMDERKYDRAAEDLGNIVNVGHLNLAVADQVRATSYYVSGLGVTRDPYVNTGIGNMWINVGVSQFHLPTGTPERFRGVVGLVVPDRAALLTRLAAVRPELDATRFGAVSLGMAYLAFDVPSGTAAGIARFYRDIIGAQAEAVAESGVTLARVTVGAGQHFLFRETDAPEQSYDGHHVQIYVCDFSGPYRRLLERGLIFQESNQHQYRFKDIVDLDSGRVLYTIDHEMRSLQHPFYGRPLVNRNPAQTVQSYRPGRDALAWSIA